MELTLSTPALLFSAISLILLAYTNRFLALAAVVRNLSDKYQSNPDESIKSQITNLRLRLKLVRIMQIMGLASLLLCVLSMFFIYIGFSKTAEIQFGIALLMLVTSLLFSIWEIQISVKALNVHLKSIED